MQTVKEHLFPRRAKAEKHFSDISANEGWGTWLNRVSQNGSTLKYAAEEFRNDREIVLTAVQENGRALEYAAEEFRSDREIVLTAVQKDEYALLIASEECRNDREVAQVIAQMMYSENDMQRAPKALRNSRAFMLATVRANGLYLRYATEELRKDREVVFTAIIKNGLALQYASEELRNDLVILLAARRARHRS